VTLPQNRGLSAARNAGLARARGAHLAFQDDDDLWHPEKLERQLRVLSARPEVGVVFSDMHRVHRDGRRQYFHSPPIERDRLVNPDTGYWQTYMLAMQPTLIRREVLGAHRFDESLAHFEDLDLHLRLSRHHHYLHLREPLVDYYDTAGLTSDFARELRGRWQMLRKYSALLIAREPAFLVREAVRVKLRRSLLPIAQAHWTDLESASLASARR
jgi:glycosyltransferase involved in cell wall biosynthesis